jgi:hypothetical protein
MVTRGDVSVAAPRVYNSDMSIQESARNLPSWESGLFGRQSLLTRLFPNNIFSRRYLARDKIGAKEPFQVEQVGATCMIFPWSLLDEVGPWDEGFFAYWVDTDWCIRLKKMNKKIFCVPEARVIHYESNRRGRKKSPFRIWLFHWGAYRLYRKHYTVGIFGPRALIAIVALCMRAGLLIVANFLIFARGEDTVVSKLDNFE